MIYAARAGHFRRIVALSELGRLEEAKAIIEMVQQMDGLSSGELVDLARLEETLSTAEAQEESIQCVQSLLSRPTAQIVCVTLRLCVSDVQSAP